MNQSTRDKWAGRWDQLKGKVKSIWGDLTDDELDKAQGDFQQLVGKIKEKTGETEEDIERRLNAA
jgi:uncharacterized protein YjbJ (UPF0337 family)